MKQIDLKIEQLEKRQRVTFNTIEKIQKWWSANDHVIGRHLGEFSLVELKYNNAYSGMFADYIIYDEETEREAILGYGYTGTHCGADHYTFEKQNATRETHINFIRSFCELVKEKIVEAEKIEAKIDGLTLTIPE